MISSLASKVRDLKLLEESKQLPAARELAIHIKTVTPNTILASSRLQNLRFYLRNNGYDDEFIKQTRIPEITISAQKERDSAGELRDAAPMTIPAYFSLRNVSDRISQMPREEAATIPDVCDVMVALAMRPSEVTTLHVSKDGVTGYSKGTTHEPRPLASFCIEDWKQAEDLLFWIRKSLALKSSLNPASSSGAKIFKKFLNSVGIDKLSTLRKIGADYTGDMLGTGTIASKIAYMRLALRHSDASHPSSVEFYGRI